MWKRIAAVSLVMTGILATPALARETKSNPDNHTYIANEVGILADCPAHLGSRDDKKQYGVEISRKNTDTGVVDNQGPYTGILDYSDIGILDWKIKGNKIQFSFVDHESDKKILLAEVDRSLIDQACEDAAKIGTTEKDDDTPIPGIKLLRGVKIQYSYPELQCSESGGHHCWSIGEGTISSGGESIRIRLLY